MTSFMSHGDVGMCLNCRTQNNYEVIGTLHIGAGVQKSLFKCKSCNALHHNNAGGIEAVLNEVSRNGEIGVGFTVATGTTATGNNYADITHNLKKDYNGKLEVKDQDTQNALTSLNGTIANLQYAIDSLVNRLDAVVTKNNQLMEKLASDPLIGIRKAVAEFTLK